MSPCKHWRNRAVFVVIGLWGAILAVGFGATGGETASLSYIFTETGRYEPKAWLEGHDRFPAGANLVFIQNGMVHLVAPGFHSSADAAVSYDAAGVLFAGKRAASDHWQVWEKSLSGGMPRQITHCDSDCIRPLYLPTGAIVYTHVAAKQNTIEVDGKPLTFAPRRYLTDDVLRDGRILFEAETTPGIRELYTVYPDGTGVEALRCDHGPDRGEAKQLASGDYIFRSGKRLARITSRSAEQMDLEQPDTEGVGPVAEASPGVWLMTLRKKAGHFGLYEWRSDTHQISALEPLPHSADVQPVVVARQTPPREFPSALVPTRTSGNLLCLNSRTSRTPMDGAAVRTVRAYTQNESGKEVLLGQTPVEGDGSFYIQVPADRPLRLELADSAGRTVRAEEGWFWMRPSEQRICVGCHAGPERAPENKVPEILLRTIVPVKMLEARQ